jgi:PII-like signaling protein
MTTGCNTTPVARGWHEDEPWTNVRLTWPLTRNVLTAEVRRVKTFRRAVRLSIFIGEGDTWHHKPLYSEIVHRAHQAGLAGATVIRGIEGYGATSHIHTTHVLQLSEDLPLLIIIIDEDSRIREFVRQLDELCISGLVALDEIEGIRYAVGESQSRH